MRKKLAAIGGLVFALALGAPAAAQAGTTQAGTAQAGIAHGKATAAPEDTVEGCGSLWDYGNQKYAAIDDNNFDLYFQPLSTLGAAPQFCNDKDPDYNGLFLMADPNHTNLCLGIVDDPDGPAIADVGCDNTAGLYDTWEVYATHGTYHGNTIYQIEADDSGSGQCLYDDQQEPAVLASCSDTSDHFEWFVWSGANL